MDRKQIFTHLRSENIGVHVHYIPVYKQPYYAELGYEDKQCEAAEAYYETAITLPLFPTMSEDDIQDVIEAVKKIYKQFKLSL